MSDKHTPTPWEVDERFKTLVKGAPGYSVATTGGYSNNTMDPDELNDMLEANARHIVKCVNNHERLVEALWECVSCFNCPEWSDKCEESENNARALLAQLDAQKE